MTFVDAFVECEFVEYLRKRIKLDAGDEPQAGEWSRVGNTIGALTLRLNLMSESQIDQVL